MFMRLLRWSGLRWIRGLQTGESTSSRKTVTTRVGLERALEVSTFWGCVKLMCEVVGSLPLTAYSVALDGTRTVDRNFHLWRLLKNNPNRYQTFPEFVETMVLMLMTSGNFYAAIERAPGTGRVISVIPLMSVQVEVRLLENGEMIYEHRSANGDLRVFSSESIMHIKMFGNGLVGLSPLSYAAQTLGIASDLQDRQGVLAASGGKTNGILMVDKKLDPDKREAIRNNFRELTEGSQDQLFVLEADMKFERTSLSPVDMELLSSRRFQVEEICRFLGVPSVLVNDTNGTTAWGSGIYQIIQGYFKLNLMPLTNKIKMRFERDLMTPAEREEYDLEFEFDELTRADFATRMESYNKGINGGILKPNEAREREHLPAASGGDNIYLNGTLVPAGTVPLRTVGRDSNAT